MHNKIKHVKPAMEKTTSGVVINVHIASPPLIPKVPCTPKRTLDTIDIMPIPAKKKIISNNAKLYNHVTKGLLLSMYSRFIKGDVDVAGTVSVIPAPFLSAPLLFRPTFLFSFNPAARG